MDDLGPQDVITTTDMFLWMQVCLMGPLKCKNIVLKINPFWFYKAAWFPMATHFTTVKNGSVPTKILIFLQHLIPNYLTTKLRDVPSKFTNIHLPRCGLNTMRDCSIWDSSGILNINLITHHLNVHQSQSPLIWSRRSSP